jgi:uncharacterized protein YceK
MRLGIVTAAIALALSGVANAATESVLYQFQGGNDGSNLDTALVADSTGALYGNTYAGGGSANCTGGCGTIYKLTPPATVGGPWTETVLYAFTGGSDGARPHARLLPTSNGHFFGVAQNGGSTNYSGGCGVVFALSPPTKAGGPWTTTTIYTFLGGGDGDYPSVTEGLIADHTGALYGTTTQGATISSNSPSGCGTVFKLTPPSPTVNHWTKTILYSFQGGRDGNGSYSISGLLGGPGALYGTTALRGLSCGINPNGCGTVFKLTPPATAGGAWTETVLYRFTGGSDGGIPGGGVITDGNGHLYGMTADGGSSSCFNPAIDQNCGVVYRLAPPATTGGAWKYSVLYAFQSTSDGNNPFGNLIVCGVGSLCGETGLGGSTNCFGGCGTVVKLTAPTTPGGAWTESVLYAFTGGSDGEAAQPGLLIDSTGALYGPTAAGGTGSCTFGSYDTGCGTVFKLTP